MGPTVNGSNPADLFYRAVIRKDRDLLERILDKDFTMQYMDGKIHIRGEFIESVMNGTLNYHKRFSNSQVVFESGGHPVIQDRSLVEATVFSMPKGWRKLGLNLEIDSVKDAIVKAYTFSWSR